MLLALPAWAPPFLALGAVALGHRRRGADPVETLFNVGQTALSVTAAAVTLRIIEGAGGLGPDVDGVGSLGGIGVASAVLYGVNAALVAGVVAPEYGAGPMRLWWRSIGADLGAHAALTALGVVAALIAVEHPLALPVLALPAVLVHHALRQAARLRDDTHDALAALVEVVELRDPYTAGHSRRVAATARALALRLGLTAEEADAIACAGRVHDVGKAALDPAVLAKPAPLTDAEVAAVRRHPVLGAAVVARFAAYGAGHRLVRHHHEAWDGSGYPDGLAGAAIPLGARILAVADAFDAMTSARPYRRALGVDAAIAELRHGAGVQWDPRVVEAATAWLGEAADQAGASATRARPAAREGAVVEAAR
jgi:hypothetical protein